MIKSLARLAAVLVLAVGALVACSDNTPACAANAPRPSQPRSNTGGSYRYKPPATSRSTGSSGSRQPSSRRTVYIPQPVPVIRYDGWHSYPGYPGWWAPGMYPPGYVDHYHCRPVNHEDD